MADIRQPPSGLRQLDLFAGAGGGILTGLLLGWRIACAVEKSDYCQRLLCARQDDGTLPPFPLWDDVATFDGRPWRGAVDVVSGGFPCQGFSAAGKKRGFGDARSSLWDHMARVIGEVRPRYVFLENSPRLVPGGLSAVLSALDALGYDAEWGVLGGQSVGAPCIGERLWLVAAAADRRDGRSGMGLRQHGMGFPLSPGDQAPGAGPVGWELPPPGGDGRMDHGLADRLDRMRALGNGWCPQLAAQAWRVLLGRLGG